MPRKIMLLAASALCAGALGGCETYDPQLRAGVWHPIHPNRANLAMMAASPADLVHGHGSQTTDGILAAAAIDRLESNKLKKLPDAGLSDVQVKSQGTSGE
jgi:hypothetical protein